MTGAKITPLSLAEQREQDRERFPDPAFNRWLDEAIDESGQYTVWDAIGDTCAAWAGWDNRPHYADNKLRDAAEQALAWLQAEASTADEDCGDPQCAECNGIIRPLTALIDALSKALR